MGPNKFHTETAISSVYDGKKERIGEIWEYEASDSTVKNNYTERNSDYPGKRIITYGSENTTWLVAQPTTTSF